MKYSHNPYSGRLSVGFRFCFHVTSIAHRPLFLPIEMKTLPQIQRLLKGESPLSVFCQDSIKSARMAFCDLRERFDFAYWAAREYYIRDIHDADKIVPLRLNGYQHYIIDILQKRFTNRQQSCYLVTKSFRPCGVTTCIQAYQLWLQTFKCPKHSFTCSASEISLHPLKENISRFLSSDVVSPAKSILLPGIGCKAFFNTFRNPDYIRGIDLGYLHFADMSRWHDNYGALSSRVYAAARSSVLMKHDTLVVLEGNTPRDERLFLRDIHQLRLSAEVRMSMLSNICCNPFFLDHVSLANIPNIIPHFFHINLNYAFDPSRKVNITPSTS
ncbi:MAG: hypothetical protein K2K25_13020 [Muribaculaceae bacterium]|nr:hypothetical protein [Muribaculaceae bacterium]